jgi:hypothetical protein
VCGGSGVEVDRVGPMGGVRQEGDPKWTREKTRRRRFSEEVPEAESEGEEGAGKSGEEEKREGGLDVMA